MVSSEGTCAAYFKYAGVASKHAAGRNVNIEDVPFLELPGTDSNAKVMK
jgi:hypothetical protein